MKNQELNITFHNPNTAEATADFILKLFIEANQDKVKNAINSAAEKNALRSKTIKNRSA